jgi:beta-1,4-mannosyltransferase
LLIRRRYNFILIQNPPCVPLLLVAIIVSFLSFGRTRLIIDWHNYGFSIMRVGGSHPVLVRMAMHYETFLGRFGDKHLTVSEAMRRNLTQITAIRPEDVYVLYDRATSKFRPISSLEKRDFFERVGLSNMHNCKVLLSSTSYTPDEDFMILVRALDIVDRTIKSKI